LAKDSTLKSGWWKPGFDFPARLASDGVSAKGGLELKLSGLPAGKHTLALFHNRLSPAPAGTFTVSVTRGSTVTVTPSVMVKHDDEAASAFVEFMAQKDQDTVVTITALDGTPTLNGLELDGSNPAIRARTPNPADADMHTPPNPMLTWAADATAQRYRVYLGTTEHDVDTATPNHKEYRGEGEKASFNTTALTLNHQKPYFWRVDTVTSQGVHKGVVWSFRVRQLAFPEAEGYGRFAIGGRGGKVLEVTNLQDSGPGSLRAAIETPGPRIVVFRTGGVIELQSKLIVRHPYLTVAGQTAPGDGICIKNYTFGCSDTHDVVIRHVRIRVGDETGTTNDGSGARGSDHVIFDHCSISWSIDEGFSSREARNITVQRCLIAEALHIADHKKYQAGKGHSFAGSISGNVGSYHHNLLAHCTGRNWSLAGGLDRTGEKLAGRLDLRNNVVYNWLNRTTDGGVRELAFVNNYYIPGPATKTFTLLKPDPNDWQRGMTAYMAGNVIEGKDHVNMDNWSAYVGPEETKAQIRLAKSPFESNVKTHSAKEACESVLADVGATKPQRDAVDERVLKDVQARSHTYTGSKGKLPGIIDSSKDAGGWPKYAAGTPPKDTDHDGMPDDWEQTHGLNANNPRDAHEYRRDGYTHLEHYLNELAQPTMPPSQDAKYRDTITKRARNAVAACQLRDEVQAAKAVTIVEAHYLGINEIHFRRDEAIKAATTEAAVTEARTAARQAVDLVHATFTKDLATVLTADHCDVVKDKMTYDVRVNTFKVYCEMLPQLTEAQKTMIQAHLRDGREEALIAGNAEEKHEKFRVAKGKITNELSKQGYDMKKAAADWDAKRKATPNRKPE
jgi:hypothetical protein